MPTVVLPPSVSRYISIAKDLDAFLREKFSAQRDANFDFEIAVSIRLPLVRGPEFNEFKERKRPVVFQLSCGNDQSV